MISINEAVEQGVSRLRKPVWSDRLAHMAIGIKDGQLLPWLHVFDPYNLECNGRDPVDVLCVRFDLESKDWEPYDGPDNDSEEYKAAQRAYADNS